MDTVLAGTSVALPWPMADKVVGVFGKFLLVVFAGGAVACGLEAGSDAEACGKDRSTRDVEISKSSSMEEAEFLTGASVGGVSADNRRSVTFITEMPLCVCSNVDVFVRGSSWLSLPAADVTLTVSLIQNGEVTSIDLESPASGFTRWEQAVPLQTKGHAGLSYSFSILINYSFPSVGSTEDDVAELRRLMHSLDCTATYTTFTREPCANLNL